MFMEILATARADPWTTPDEPLRRPRALSAGISAVFWVEMRHDLFHVYTVDEHILMVVRNLRRFVAPEFGHEYPYAAGSSVSS